MDKSNYGWGSSSASSSRKGKKEKQRQPQRGLGVAQLEKIRIQSEMAEYQLPSIQSPFSNLNMSDARVSASVSPSQAYTARTTAPVPFGGVARREAFYSEPHSTPHLVSPSLNAPRNIYPANFQGQPNVTLPLFEGDREEYMSHYDRRWSTDSRSQNSDSSGTQDVDLELKL